MKLIGVLGALLGLWVTIVARLHSLHDIRRLDAATIASLSTNHNAVCQP
jgi:hypothetical protein